jgi:LmbE family N-acetylglucosaminyl deacetylase
MTDPIRRVLVITAHPDDCEFGAGGTVAAFVRQGRDVGLLVVTNGD